MKLHAFHLSLLGTFQGAGGNPVKLSLSDAWVPHLGAQDSLDLENAIYTERQNFNRMKLVGLGKLFEPVINGLTTL